MESSGIFGVTLALIGMEALMLCVLTRASMLAFRLGMGCFWGAERLFWRLPGVFSTQVGYAGGFTPNPNYHEVCSGNNTLCICMPCTHGHVLTDPAPFPPRRGGGEVVRQDVSPSDQSGFKTLKNAKGKWRVGRGEKRAVLSTALSSSHRLPFICSQLLRMHCSRWAVPPVPTSP